MNRIGLVALFTALKSHVENKDMESIKKIVYAVLDETQHIKTSNRNDCLEFDIFEEAHTWHLC